MARRKPEPRETRSTVSASHFTTSVFRALSAATSPPARLAPPQPPAGCPVDALHSAGTNRRYDPILVRGAYPRRGSSRLPPRVGGRGGACPSARRRSIRRPVRVVLLREFIVLRKNPPRPSAPSETKEAARRRAEEQLPRSPTVLSGAARSEPTPGAGDRSGPPTSAPVKEAPSARPPPSRSSRRLSFARRSPGRGRRGLTRTILIVALTKSVPGSPSPTARLWCGRGRGDAVARRAGHHCSGRSHSCRLVLAVEGPFIAGDVGGQCSPSCR